MLCGRNDQRIVGVGQWEAGDAALRARFGLPGPDRRDGDSDPATAVRADDETRARSPSSSWGRRADRQSFKSRRRVFLPHLRPPNNILLHPPLPFLPSASTTATMMRSLPLLAAGLAAVQAQVQGLPQCGQTCTSDTTP